MKKTFILLSVLVFMIISSCKKESNSGINNSKPEIKYSDTEKKLAANSNTFGLELFKTISAGKKAGENLMVSPLSVSLAIGMVYNGSAGDTKTAIENTLFLQGLTDTEINEAFKGLIDKLTTADNTVTFNIANSIWYRNTFQVLPEFLTTNRNYYYAEVTPLNFADEGSVNTINNWVADKTNNKIDKIIESIDPYTMMILLNAIYFKGSWKYEFDKKNTVDFPFHYDDNSVKNVSMMMQEGDLNITHNEYFSAVELPYGKQQQFSMVIMVPAKNKSTDDILAHMNDANWNQWLNSFALVKDYNIGIPKFKFEYEKSLVDVLTAMGMGIAFSDNADFSRINATEDLQITEVKHKTYIDVNEEGTEAAAVTSVIVGTTSAGDNYLYADKPFLFVIREKQTNAILFIGKVAAPEYN